MHPWHTLQHFLILLLGSHGLGLLLADDAACRSEMTIKRVEKERLEEADFSSPEA